MKHLKIFSNKNEFEESAILISKPFVALDRQNRTVYYSNDKRGLFEYKVPLDKIYYRTSNNQKLNMYSYIDDDDGKLYIECLGDSSSTDSIPILSHTYENGIGIIQFEGYTIEIPAFYDSNFNRYTDFITNLTEMYFPDGIFGVEVEEDGGTEYYDYFISTIGENYFKDCSNLHYVKLPGNLNNIKSSAFKNCTSLSSIEIPNSISEIDDSAFYGCTSLTSIKLEMGGDYNYIYGSAFADCTSLTTIELLGDITICGDDVFKNCTSLRNIIVSGNVNMDGDYTIFGNCTNLTLDLFGLNISSVNKSDIPLIAMSELETVILPEKAKVIDEESFSSCDNIKNIILGESVTSIGYSAFSYCYSLTSIVIPNSVTYIGASAFDECRELKTITLSNNLTSIDDGAFYECTSLTSIVIPNSVTSIGNSAFYYCGELKTITLSNNLTSIDDSAFYECTSLTSIVIPNSVTSIGNSAFYGCTYLSSVVLPNINIHIFSNAFDDCESLTSIVIPSAITDTSFITPYMTNIEFKATTPPDVSGANIESFTSDNVITVPNGCLNTYLADSSWDSLNNYATIVEASV